MTKHDWFWVAVKVAGLCMLVYSVVMLTTMVTLLGDLPFGSMLGRLLINVGAVGFAGFWMIRDGRLLVSWARASDQDVEPRP